MTNSKTGGGNDAARSVKIGSIDLMKLDERTYNVLMAAPKSGRFEISDIAGITFRPPAEVKRLVTQMVDQGVLTRTNSSDGAIYQLTKDGTTLKERISKNGCVLPVY
jgi:CTP-dependent riboflavin kinase